MFIYIIIRLLKMTYSPTIRFTSGDLQRARIKLFIISISQNQIDEPCSASTPMDSFFGLRILKTILIWFLRTP